MEERGQEVLLQRQNETDTPEAGLRLAESCVKKYYLDNVGSYMVKNMSRTLQKMTPTSSARLYRLTGVVLNKNEKVLERLNNVYSAMHSLGLSIIMLLASTKTGAEFYLGVRAPKGRAMDPEIAGAFERTFYGNFPGSTICPLEDDRQIESVLNRILPVDGSNAVTTLSSIPALKDENAENEKFTQGIEKVLDTMQGTEYAILVIADPVNKDQLAWTKQGYEELYSELSPLAQSELTIGKSDARSLSISEMDGLTETISTSVSKTQSFTQGTSSAQSESRTNTLGISLGAFGSRGTSHSDGMSGSINAGVEGKIPFVKKGPTVSAGISVAKSVMDALSLTAGLNGGVNASTAKTTGYTETESESWQTGMQVGQQYGTGKTHQSGTQQGITKTGSTSVTVHSNNKSIRVMLELIDDQLKRIRDCENYGVWSSAAYFLAPSRENSVVAASAYKGIINGEGTAVETSSMSTWFKDENTRRINAYLRRLCHPHFVDPEYLSNFRAMTDVVPTVMINTKELAIQCNIPYRSVAGVMVREMAEFGRNVPEMTATVQDRINLGKVCHMGRKEAADLILDRQAMTSHTFITGSTGTGKSNAVYHLLDEITKDGKTSFLVVEPAKGEYKNIFGCGKAVVYGTNATQAQILRINPFAFPSEIHVLEHIDRLVEIFNACWPMYAAMPAILKDAMERCYREAGWDLRHSTSNRGGVFPTFYDLLDILPSVIEESRYSNDTQSDYIGALYTRVKSLTNGIYGSVLCAEDALDDAELFDRNAIVDMSRVGSSETKSLLMGILVMKLQEYRMCSGMMNSELRHITVLEEAHNLLRRTSDSQFQESANLQGKSVEMLTNAIAEMRTYGEGFIVADQAPGLLDPAVIRNTNTKIILRLPEEEDRRLVGKAAGLNEQQIHELAKLPLGVAAVYQNNWPEAVLCQMERYPMTQTHYRKPTEAKTVIDTASVFRQIKDGSSEKLLACERDQLELWIKRYAVVLGEEGCQIVRKSFAPEQKLNGEEREMLVERFFGSRRSALAYCRADQRGQEPRQEMLDRLENQYGLEPQTADWVLNQAMTTAVNQCDREVAEELRASFLAHQGRLL